MVCFKIQALPHRAWARTGSLCAVSQIKNIFLIKNKLPEAVPQGCSRKEWHEGREELLFHLYFSVQMFNCSYVGLYGKMIS